MTAHGEWQFNFDAPKGQRMMKRFRSATTFSDLWWCNRNKRFVPSEARLPDGGSNHSPPIRSMKAFKRFLRNHKELQSANEVILCHRYVGFNVTARFVGAGS